MGALTRACQCGQIQLRRNGNTGIGLEPDDGFGSLKGRSQEIYDIIEISLIIDAGEPDLIGGLA